MQHHTDEPLPAPIVIEVDVDAVLRENESLRQETGVTTGPVGSGAYMSHIDDIQPVREPSWSGLILPAGNERSTSLDAPERFRSGR
ncbi:MAG: hypothetical protein FJY67_01800 [Calditrichaeota bacterium]|nr:hypothetical protein [Calditrichota bacterium]